LEAFSSQNPQEAGKVQVLVNIRPIESFSGGVGNLVESIRQGLAVPVFATAESLTYVLASLMIALSFILGVIYFSRASRACVEARNRNPLTQNVIRFTIFLNIFLTIVIVLAGLSIAYLIITRTSFIFPR